MALLEQLVRDLVVLVGVVALLAPGFALWVALRPHLTAAPEIAPAVVVAGAVITAVPLTCVAVSAEIPGRYVSVAWLVLSAVAVVYCAVLTVRRRRVATSGVDEADQGRGLRWAPWAVAGAGALTSWVIRGDVSSGGDTPYHVAQALKLQRLPAPGLHTTLQYPDGSASPGYLIPVWHEIVAIMARVLHVAPIDLFVLLPVILVPVAMLTWSAIARLTFTSPDSAWVAGIAMLAGVAGATTTFVAIGTASQPRSVAAAVLLPLVLCLMLLDARRTGVEGGRQLRLAAVGATVAVGVLHITYVPMLVVMVATVPLAAWLVDAAPREMLRRSWASVGWLVAAGLAMTVAIWLAPVTRSITQGPPSDTLLTRLDGAGWLQVLQPWHLQDNGLQLAGVIGCAVLAWRPQLRARVAGAWAPLLMVIVIVVATVPPLFHVASLVIATNQAARAYLIVPWVIGLVALVLTAADLIHAARMRSRAADIMTAVAIGGVAIAWGILVATAYVDPLDVGEEVRLFTRFVVWASGVAILMGLVRSRRPVAESQPGRSVPGAETVSRAALVVIVIMVLPVITVTATRPWTSQIQRGLVARAPAFDPDRPISRRIVPPAAADGLRIFDRGVGRALDDLAPGDLLLAESTIGYKLMALAPVYVVGQDAHVVLTPANRQPERLRELDLLLSPDTPDDVRASHIVDGGIDWIIVDRDEQPELAAFLDEHPDLVERRARNFRVELWRVR